MFSEALAQRLVSVSADIADLRAWKQSVYLYERLVLPCAFIAELPQNLAPACIADLPCQIRALLKHLSDIEAFCTDQVIRRMVSALSVIHFTISISTAFLLVNS